MPLRFATIAWRLPLVIGGLSLLVTFALAFGAYRYVRTMTMEAAGQQLDNTVGEMVRALTIQAEGYRTVARAASQLPDTARPRADTIPPSVYAAAGTAPDSAAIGGFVADSAGLWFPVVVRRADGSWFVRWQRLPPNERTAAQLRTLVSPEVRFAIGGGSGVWTDLAQVVPAPPLGAAGDSTAVVVSGADGDLLVSARSTRRAPWTIMLALPMATVLAPPRAFLRNLSLAALGLSALALLIAWWQGRRIARPLREFSAATLALSGADFSRRVSVGGHDELAQLAGTFNLMAGRIEEEVAARSRSEKQWRTMFASNPLPMWIIEMGTWKFLAVNQAAVRHYGYSEAEFLAMELKDIHAPEDLDRLAQAQSRSWDEPVAASRARHRRKDGSIIEVDITSNAVPFAGHAARLALAQDVTNRLALEGELRQAQKMEAVGRLAAGVAHDFNNVLAVIRNYAELLREDLAADPERGRDLDEIVRASDHAASLTRQLLAFSRQQVTRPELVGLNTLVRRHERMVRPLIGARITLAFELDPDAGRVRADPAQLEQVLLNLAINARDAMPDGGTLTIATGRDGDDATLTVRDTGVGMSPEVRVRVFEPFFTTKDEGKGSGLGLATAYGIIAQAGGRITVSTTPGRGSSFTVRLPREAGPDDAAPTPARAAVPDGAGTETILLAEDEPGVRSTVTSILKRRGYTVIAAANGDEALALAAAHEGPMHLLVSDVVMPGMTGPALYQVLKQRHPGLKCLFMSGYAGDALRQHGLDDSNIPFLEKPFSMQALAEKVREALLADHRHQT